MHHVPAELLPRAFFDRPSPEVAPDLLGCVFWSSSPDGLVAVRLTEVEAYEGGADPASHAFRGQTARNAVMFGPAGHAYVYFTYGMHYCVNLVCQPPGQPSAVLLRAGQVIEGAGLAAARRSGGTRSGGPRSGGTRSGVTRSGGTRERDLARGPGRLGQALGIDRALDGTDVCTAGSALGIGRQPGGPDGPGPDQRGPGQPGPGQAVISTGPRVGISRAADWPLRFWLADDRYVSDFRPAVPR